MKALWYAALLTLLPVQHALAWGQEGHSIIAEIAQHEVSPHTRSEIDKILNHASLALACPG